VQVAERVAVCFVEEEAGVEDHLVVRNRRPPGQLAGWDRVSVA
jgi:hypothetical protein